MIEAGVGQPLEPLAREQHAGRDEVGVEADLGRLRDDLLEVAAHGRLAAGQVQLQHAEVGGLRQHVAPDLGRQLAARRAPAPAGWSSRGIAAGSDASARRAARSAARMRARLRPGAVCGCALTPVTTPLSASSCSMATTSVEDALLRRVVGLRQLRGDGSTLRAAVAQLQNGDGDGVGREHALGRQHASSGRAPRRGAS